MSKIRIPISNVEQMLKGYARLREAKGLVCRSVDTLVRRGYLTSEEDAKDHRILHLRLTQKAAPVIGQMRVSMDHFSQTVTRGISEEELAVYTRVQHQIYANIEAMTNRKGD